LVTYEFTVDDSGEDSGVVYVSLFCVLQLRKTQNSEIMEGKPCTFGSGYAA